MASAKYNEYDDPNVSDTSIEVEVDGVIVHEATREEWCAMLDRRAREVLGMSGEEFVRKWEAGEIDDPDRSEVLVLAFMIPGTRYE